MYSRDYSEVIEEYRTSLSLTLVLLHEGPHVSLLRAVCKGAVPHILAFAAILSMDAKLWVGKRKPAESHRAVS